MHSAPAWQHVMLHGLPACPCVERMDGRDYARVACSDCNGAGVRSERPKTLRELFRREPNAAGLLLALGALTVLDIRAKRAAGADLSGANTFSLPERELVAAMEAGVAVLAVLLDQIGDETARDYVPDDATIAMFSEAHAMTLKLMLEFGLVAGGA